MQFVMVIYQGSTPLPGSEAWESMPAEDQKQVYADYGALNTTPGLTSGPPLGLPSDACTVRVADGETTTADGPYAGVENAVGGFFVLEADDLDAAVAIAAKVPAARLGGAVEVRPVGTYW